jgi:hypothetical protein
MIVEGIGQQLGEVQVDKKRPDIESGNVNELRRIEENVSWAEKLYVRL